MYRNSSMVARGKGDLMATCDEIIHILNGVMDDVILRRKFTFDFNKYLCSENVSRAEIEKFNSSKFIDTLKEQINEFEDFLKGGDQYLREAYPGYTKPEVRKMKNYIQGLLDDALNYEQLKKKRSPRKTKKRTTTK